ncbi:phage terminase small subunit [Sporosarcina sp. OR05]|uniref:phage terminase small subunit n=1 Tax=Sporosarcina sp. OR05 TaxID=2969819 RepID=UPI00352B741C
MARQRSPNRAKALKMWLESGRTMMLKDIAEALNISAGLVRKWKSVDRWDDIPDTQPKRRGAPFRNKNAVGNKGGAPLNNKNAEKHGLFSKWLPDDDELKEIYEATRTGMNTLDILYEEILVMFTNFIRAQKIMYVRDQEDITKEIKKEKSYSDDKSSSEEIEYDIQYAWDKQAKALTSQAVASRAISTKIKQYEELLRTLPPEEIKESHRLRMKKLKADIKAVEAKAW